MSKQKPVSAGVARYLEISEETLLKASETAARAQGLAERLLMAPAEARPLFEGELAGAIAELRKLLPAELLAGVPADASAVTEKSAETLRLIKGRAFKAYEVREHRRTKGVTQELLRLAADNRPAYGSVESIFGGGRGF